jgi:two-component system chemotaxis response regulator CheY
MTRHASRRILIVDDSAAVRASLESLLEPYGFEVEHAGDGAAGLRRCEAGSPDLVLLDLHMPVLDGPTMLRLLRQRGHATPVILVTSASDTKLLQSVIKLGATDYVCKPFDPAQIHAALARALALDPGQLVRETPRVLLVDSEVESRRLLVGALPAHVEVDEAAGPEAAEELAARHAYRLVLVDGASGRETADPLGAALRDLQPEAALYLMDDPERTSDARRRVPTGPYDGAVAHPPDARAVTDLLYPVCIRNLVVRDRQAVTVAAFRGLEEDQPIHFVLVARRLRAAVRATLRERTSLVVDLSRLPPHAEQVATLIDATMAEAEALAVEPEFVVDPGVRAALAAARRSWPAVVAGSGELD